MRFMPLLLDVGDKKVIIFGGGKVGARRAKLFSSYSKDVTVLSGELDEKKENWGGVKVVHQRLRETDIESFLSGAQIAVAATNDPHLNDRIVSKCRELGVMVNRADVGERDFIVPSILTKGSLTISVSSEGKSPALSRILREKLEKELGEEFGLMADLQDDVKSSLEGIDRTKKREILTKILHDEDVWELLRKSMYDQACGMCKKRYLDAGEHNL